MKCKVRISVVFLGTINNHFESEIKNAIYNGIKDSVPSKKANKKLLFVLWLPSQIAVLRWPKTPEICCGPGLQAAAWAGVGVSKATPIEGDGAHASLACGCITLIFVAKIFTLISAPSSHSFSSMSVQFSSASLHEGTCGCM